MILINEHDLISELVERGAQQYGLSEGIDEFRKKLFSCTDATEKRIENNLFVNVYEKREFEWRTESGDDVIFVFDVMVMFEYVRGEDDTEYYGTFFYIH